MTNTININTANTGEVVVGLNEHVTTNIWSEVVVGFNEHATTNIWIEYIKDPYKIENLMNFIKYAIDTDNKYAYRTIFLTEMKKLARYEGEEMVIDSKQYYHGIDIYFNQLLTNKKYNIIESLISGFVKNNKKIYIKDTCYRLSQIMEIILNVMNTDIDFGLIVFRLFFTRDLNFIVSIAFALYNGNKIDLCKEMLDVILSEYRTDLTSKYISLIKQRLDISTLLPTKKEVVVFEPENNEKAKLYNEYSILENYSTWDQYWRALNFSMDFKNPLDKDIVKYINETVNVDYFIDASEEYWDNEYVKEINIVEYYNDFFNTFGVLFSHPDIRDKCVELGSQLYWKNFISFPLTSTIIEECKKYVDYFSRMKTYEHDYNTSNNLKFNKVIQLNKINCDSLVRINFESMKNHINKYVLGEKKKEIKSEEEED
jgi:hypothetical protein